MFAIQNAMVRRHKKLSEDRLAGLAERVRAVEAEPSNPYANAALSAEIGILRDQQKRILTKQDRERLSREARHRKETLEHEAYAKGFEAGRRDALGREYSYSHDTTRDAHDAFYKACAALDAVCGRLNDPELSDIAHQIAASALSLTRAADALYNQAVDMVTEQRSNGPHIPALGEVPCRSEEPPASELSDVSR